MADETINTNGSTRKEDLGILIEGEPTWERMGKIAALCVNAVHRHFGEELDYTPESLAVLDRVIMSGWGESSPPDNSDRTAINLGTTLGAYVGEIVVRRTQGRWVSGITDLEPASILFLGLNDRPVMSFSPFEFVRQKLQKPYDYDLTVAWAILNQQIAEQYAS